MYKNSIPFILKNIIVYIIKYDVYNYVFLNSTKITIEKIIQLTHNMLSV